MEFKLSFVPQPPPKLLRYTQPVLLTGSCFSEHIAALLQGHYFDVMSQPNGVVFNPISIAQHLERAIGNAHYNPNDLHLHNELWHSWHHHGSFSATEKNSALDAMNASLEKAHVQLNKPGCVLMITLGSAWVYALKNDEQLTVANCHKYPQQQFTKRLLMVEEIVQAMEKTMRMMPNTSVYFTVSPVRHVRDGLVENNLGKAILLQAVHELCKRFAHCYYFPAYEIVIDELRDHRFYNSDMIHPNQQAVHYVWQRFAETCMDEDTKIFVNETARLNGMLAHKVLHADTQAYQKFEASKSENIKAIEEKYNINIKRERS